MSVVRPEGISQTPRRLAELLGTDTKRYPSRRNTYDADTDVFTVYPEPSRVSNRGDRYNLCYGFFSRNKYQQRQALQQWGVPTPRSYQSLARSTAALAEGGSFIVRSLRHSGGAHYRVTNSPRDFIEGQEYISEVFPKTREYRWICVSGRPIVFLRKRPDDGVPTPGVAEPWNHTRGLFFRTVNRPDDSRLPQEEVLRVLRSCPVVQAADLIGIDILFNQRDNSWVVCEINSCPGISIEDNLNRVAEALRR